jgi:hypothetical protein
MGLKSLVRKGRPHPVFVLNALVKQNRAVFRLTKERQTELCDSAGGAVSVALGS